MARREGRVESYRTKGGEELYRIRYDLPPTYDPDTGQLKRRQQSRSGFRTSKEANRALREALGRRDEGHAAVEPSRDPLAKYLTAWLSGLRGAATTRDNYRVAAEVHTIPRIGGVRLAELTAEHVDALYRELEAHGKAARTPTGKTCRTAGVTCRDQGCDPDAHEGLSAKSVRHVHTMLRKALQDAVQRGYLLRNVADLANPPTQKDARSRRARDKAWTTDQLRAFLTAAEDDRLAPLWRLLATTGLRRGELLGLGWSDVDLDAGRLTVRRSTTEVDGRVVESDWTKTDAGQRTLDLDPKTVAALRAWRKRQREDQLAALGWQDTGRIATREDGAVLRPSYLSRRFLALCRRQGLPEVGVHGLRHSYATAALRAGVSPEVVSKRLGHSSVAITLSIYAHVLERDDRAAAELTAAAIDGG
jgi:integrase